jgi:NhaP-type Na+/H+ or K+/H+ antiporter
MGKRGSRISGPLGLVAVGQVAGVAGSGLLGIAYPSDAPLAFGPQAVGGALVAVAVALFAARLAAGVSEAGRLRLPMKVGAAGFTIMAIGWVFYAFAVRDRSWEVITAASLGALLLATEAAATVWVLRRMEPTRTHG